MLLVLVLLVALAVTPAVVQWRVSHLRDEINNVADPAVGHVADVELQLSEETAARRGYLLSGDTVLAQRARAARAARHIAQDSARRLVRRLDPAAAAEMAALDRQLAATDMEVDSLLAAAHAVPEYRMGLAERERHTGAARASVQRLSSRLQAAAARRRDGIGRTERAGQAASIILALAALAGAIAVGRIARRYRALAMRLDQALADAEHARDAAEERQRTIEQVTESRARLIRGFTHDVKNPLGAADGYLALLAEGVMGDLDARHQQTIGRVRRSIRTALQLIGQLLDLARAEAGQLDIASVPIRVDEVAREVVDEYLAQAREKRQVLDVSTASHIPIILSDPLRVQQIVANLVSNAVKYTPASGHIAVRVDHRADAVRVSVEDDGPGIAPDRLALLFQEFTRFDPDAAQGAGIGLAISQKIAHMLAGEITVESVVGRGSRFTLQLPREAPERRNATRPDRRRAQTTGNASFDVARGPNGPNGGNGSDGG